MISPLTVPTFWNRDDVLQLQILDWEIHDGGVLLSEVAVVDEALDMQDQVLRQLCDAVSSSALFNVIMHPLPIKFFQELIYWHL